jgi:hypothetical protein
MKNVAALICKYNWRQKMANNHLFLIMFSEGNDQEIEFQEIEIGIFQEV